MHARNDLEWAKRLQARLETDGFRAALEDHLPGDIIVRRIEELIRASKHCLFVHSRAIEGDPASGDKYAALLTRRRFVPVLLDDVELGPFAASRHPLDFRGEDQDTPYGELLRLLRGEGPGAEPLAPHRTHRLEGPREVLLRIGRDAVVLEPDGPARGTGRYGEGTGAGVRHRPGPLSPMLEERLWRLGRARERRGELLTKDGAAAGRRGAELEARLREVGTALGEIFLDGAAGEALTRALAEAAAENRALRLGLQVDDELAGLPWETLVLPGRSQPLALHPHVEPFRHLPAAGRPTAMDIRAPLRILAAVAAPGTPPGPGTAPDSPLLDLEAELRVILDSVEEARRHAAAHVRILNEGTLQSIEDALKEERFHVLHISCHAGPDALVLEDGQGGPDRVTAARLAAAIPRDRGVPLVVLSGCSTALDDSDGEGGEGGEGGARAGLARGLSAAGVPAVLAMTAPVTDRYATLLSGALYRELAVRPRPDVLTALSEARRDVEERRRRADDREAELVEWATPALFLRGPSLPLYDVAAGVDPHVRPAKAVSLDPGVTVRAVGDFVGRRAELRALRAGFRRRPGVLLHGIGGVGKSSLAAEILGRLGPEAGLVVSAVGRTGPDQILAAVADRLLAAALRAGAEAEDLRRTALALREPRYPWPLRLDALAEALADVPPALARRIGLPPVTLLLDDFEDNLDREADLSFVDQDLPGFLAAWLRTGRLLVTSRHPFTLPGGADDLLHVHHLGPLSLAEARKLMWRLPGLDALPSEDRWRAWLGVGGHPRTLEYLDALLRGGRARFSDITRRMERLIRGRGDVQDPESWLRTAGSAGLDAALAEAVTLAVDDTLLLELLDLADDFTRDLLTGVSVYRLPVDRTGVVRQVGLPLSPGDRGWPERPAATGPTGVDAAIGTLTRLGLLAPGRGDDGNPVFSVHRWTAATLARPQVSAPERITAAHAAAARWWLRRARAEQGDARRAVAEMMEARFHFHAAGDLDRALGATDWVCGRLHTWGARSWEGRLHREALAWTGEGSRDRAAVLQRIGVVVQAEGEHDRALEYYRRSLEIYEGLGDRAGTAVVYQQLGVVAEEQGRYDDALRWCREALTIYGELGDRGATARIRHNLAVIAHRQGRYDDALRWCREALDLKKELGDRPGTASGHLLLGTIAAEQGRYDDALRWYREALDVHQESGDRPGMAGVHHNLGAVAHRQKQYGDALRWYREALRLNEEIGHRAGAAVNHRHLAVLYTETGRRAEAVAYGVRSLLACGGLPLPEAREALDWLRVQRRLFGEEEFRRLLAGCGDAETLRRIVQALDRDGE
ncbi:tetratricopeptide repeat protein [Planomonospora sphaerica]|uniref:tetratricopeptide repeat protein n=1 Tax=Planomonospora sphaerica TaxID=161355 RepID=UPI000839FF23|nr:tetratricopeptide repeat protein [Planomonospora sphaerica]